MCVCVCVCVCVCEVIICLLDLIMQRSKIKEKNFLVIASLVFNQQYLAKWQFSSRSVRWSHLISILKVSSYLDLCRRLSSREVLMIRGGWAPWLALWSAQLFSATSSETNRPFVRSRVVPHYVSLCFVKWWISPSYK